MKYNYPWSPKGRDGKSLFDFEFEVECSVLDDHGDPGLEISDILVGGKSLMGVNSGRPAWMYMEQPLVTFCDTLQVVVYHDDEFNSRAFEDDGWRLIGGGNDPDTRWVREH